MARNMNPASDKQVAYVLSLFEKLLPRKDEQAVIDAVTPLVGIITKARTGEGVVTSGEASLAIDAMRPLTLTGANGVRTNRYGGKCSACGHNVAEGAGRIERNGNGKWITFHLAGECPTEAPPAPAARADEDGEALTEGFYRATDGGTWQVRNNKQGFPYAMAGIILPGVKPQWEYVRGGMRLLAGAHRLTADEAAAIGALTHHCVFCSRELTDDGEGRSVEVGYGPICARKHGLPWG